MREEMLGAELRLRKKDTETGPGGRTEQNEK